MDNIEIKRLKSLSDQLNYVTRTQNLGIVVSLIQPAHNR